jgi:hypothetical protein
MNTDEEGNLLHFLNLYDFWSQINPLPLQCHLRIKSAPFFTNYFREEFEKAAGDYSKLLRRERPAGRTRADEIFSPDFVNAFNAEFELTPDAAMDGLAELIELTVEYDSVAVETTLGTLRTRLTRARGMSPKACQAFLNTFGLFRRPAWDQPPTGFENRDLNPRRFIVGSPFAMCFLG